MNEYDLYLSGLSIPEVHEKTKIPLSTLYFRYKKRKILRTIKESHKIARSKGRFPDIKGISRPKLSEETKRKMSKAKLEWADKNAKGVSLKPNGYYEITRGENKGRSLHSVIMEQKIGRRLFSYECVHHIDECKTNNKVENLQLMTRSEHSMLHRELDKINNNIKERDIYGKFK